MESERTKLLVIMKSLLTGEIDCDSAQSHVEALRMEEFPNLFGSLYHYYTDEDIRARDPEYKEFQNKELENKLQNV